MGIEITGKLYKVFETKQVSDRFTKREFVLETADNPKYPQTVLFEITGDKIAQLDELRVGDEVSVDFQVRGREWRNPQGEFKYFNSLDVWKIRLVKQRAGQPDSRGGAHDPPVTPTGVNTDDDIPF